MSWTALSSNLTIISNSFLSILRVLWTPINFLLSLTINILLFVTLPLQYFYQLALYLLSASITFLALFETIYYYLTAALLLGLLSGTGLYYTTLFLYRLLSLDPSPSSSSSSSAPPSPSNPGTNPGTIPKKDPPSSDDKKGRTAASYRAERAARQAELAQEQLLLREPLTKISVLGSGGSGIGGPSPAAAAGWSVGSAGLNRFSLVSSSSLSSSLLPPAVGERKDLPSLLGTTIFEEEDDDDSSGEEDWRTM